MTIAFTRNETFRDDFTFRNSPAAIPLEALAKADPGELERVRASIDAGLASDRAGPYAARLQRAQGVRDLVEGRRKLSSILFA